MRSLPTLVIGVLCSISNVSDFNSPAWHGETLNFPSMKGATFVWDTNSKCKLYDIWLQRPSVSNEIQESLHPFIVEDRGKPVTLLGILMKPDHKTRIFRIYAIQSECGQTLHSHLVTMSEGC
jgi:hypothetical protein